MLIPEFTPAVITVSELNRMARLAIERTLPSAWIGGEISNLTQAPSGHWYFTLKDANATVRCAMFRNRNQFVDWRPENGMQVEVRAQATLYEPRGEFQLTVAALRRAGLGALFEDFQRLKEKLEKEGLFDPARKRAMPDQPACIGVVTSPRAAALRDVLTTLKRRWPLARVVLYPTPVQGADAAGRITAAIRSAGERRECDVLLVVRGGGGIEDLWAFNDEGLARAIAACPLPVVSGIGHETDFTIADFVADLRAPTPTGAVQLATPDRDALLLQVSRSSRDLTMDLRRRLDLLGQRLDSLSRRLQHPGARLAGQARQIGHLSQRLALAKQTKLVYCHLHSERLNERLAARRPSFGRGLERLGELRRRLDYLYRVGLRRRADRLDSLAAQLAHLNPQAVLARGYSIVRNQAGDLLMDSRQAIVDEAIAVTLAQGRLRARVIMREP
ncbi:MAG: exodeoxyribonuclease VII large subunit [Hydrogenophilales bacterium CG03_land_8_20_14_0_80_62_28]|nr:exodeoxyribonuclease VII large subunit [Betaproteobacteria bacterium]OIO76890.1 MAG: exodeoxyribonuclease VII large subunit [Hydrogenophilaceae bacterium CG1_02_62_390]PIV22248.1 MAG: exodeoxyribonuclease VII large subunit [Hydrogenophilales bacterium CG03_land_8_20_14_0_80_62_28]PIW39730.1 MAG: exodeoxyribonuclease VII large subunit [Hydrogenophilales bacterium CG15_BIG_FIL_POST_REV_8_21_14_020_62_31]PIW72060.1 MAG: exodeoxyribonuclease VII large subunit [Hydrogenophilales bacterium CG12_bi